MRIRTIALFFGLFMLLLSHGCLHSSSTSSSQIFDHPVRNMSTGLEYDTIQEAINANETFDEHVLALDSVSFDEHVVVNKSLTIFGAIWIEHPEVRSTINGSGTGDVVTIEASNVTISGVLVKNGSRGIFLKEVENCKLTFDVVVTDCAETGVYLYNSKNCTLTTVRMADSRFNFGVEGNSIEHFIHNVDDCTADGKPIVYLVNEHDMTVTENAAHVAVVNCTRITIKDQNLSNNRQGVLFAYTNDSVMRNVNTGGNFHGIYLYHSNNSVMYQNTMVDNQFGVKTDYSLNNTFYNNNFINNTLQAYGFGVPYPTNAWNSSYPICGNYWDDYDGSDLNRDGVGDEAYLVTPPTVPPELTQCDYYPLMGRFSNFKTSIDFDVDVVSNSTIDDFAFVVSNSTITMRVSNATAGQTFGFCRIRLTSWLVPGPYHVTVDGADPDYVNYSIYSDGEYRWIYFSYEHSTREIVIVPEFPQPLILLPLLIMVSVGRIVRDRKRP